MKTIWKNLILITVAAALLTSCAALPAMAADNTGNYALHAVATTSLVADLVRNVGGEHVQVTALMGAGVDPHLYKASEGDVRKLAHADVIFYNGLHLEAGLARVLERLADQRQVVAVTTAIDPNILLTPAQFKGQHDPHIWFDVSLWMQTIQPVADKLSELDPVHAQDYQKNAAAYYQELQALHAWVRQQVERLPQKQRVLITAHDAFNYFGRAYDFDVRGLQGISTQAEASTSDMQSLATFIADNHIRAIFIESSVPRRNVEAVQAAVQARGFDVQIGGELFSDALGNPGTPEGTYIGMVRHNVNTIVNALEGRK